MNRKNFLAVQGALAAKLKGTAVNGFLGEDHILEFDHDGASLLKYRFELEKFDELFCQKFD